MTEIQSAWYGGVHVYEMQVRGIPVFIRKVDSYVNATRLLKAAGLENGDLIHRVLKKRAYNEVKEIVSLRADTRLRGTWIPLPAARILAKQYGLEEECAPLFDYDMSSGVATELVIKSE